MKWFFGGGFDHFSAIEMINVECLIISDDFVMHSMKFSEELFEMLEVIFRDITYSVVNDDFDVDISHFMVIVFVVTLFL